MRWIKWDSGKLRCLRLVSARPLSLTYQVTWTHHSLSLDAPPCGALSPGSWVKERQDPPQNPGLGSYTMTQSDTGLKCSAWVSSKMQMSLARSVLPVFLTLVRIDLSDPLSDGWRGESQREGTKLGRTWTLSCHLLPC